LIRETSTMRRLALCVLLLFAASLAPGCGGANGIEMGIPKNTQPPPDFDPGGNVKPDMTGKSAPKPASNP
jgi:hypothetical protein